MDSVIQTKRIDKGYKWDDETAYNIIRHSMNYEKELFSEAAEDSDKK